MLMTQFDVVKLVGSGKSSGQVVQRFPEKDWDDCPFTLGIELVSTYVLFTI